MPARLGATSRRRSTTRIGRVLDEGQGVSGRLRAAVHGHVEPPVARREEELRDPLPLRGREEDSLTGRSHGEDPVEPAGDEEVGQRLECLVVQGRPAVAERGHGGSECTLQHDTTLELLRQ